MLTKLTLRNFKRFDDVEIELANPVVFIGPNNSGKTSAMQALALWDIGVKRWHEKRKGRSGPENVQASPSTVVISFPYRYLNPISCGANFTYAMFAGFKGSQIRVTYGQTLSLKALRRAGSGRAVSSSTMQTTNRSTAGHCE